MGIEKEYQARGAPHYHVLFWIHSAPVIAKDNLVLAWLEERITCHIPDNPELYCMVEKVPNAHLLQLLQETQVWKTYVTTCRFGFPRPACKAVIHNVNASLKKFQNI